MGRSRQFRIVGPGIARLLSCLVWAALARAGQPGRAKGADEIQVLREQIAAHRDRALAWARMADFAEATRELGEADRLFQVIKALASNQPKGRRATRGWDFGHELRLMRLRAKAHRTTLEQFGLPSNSLGFIQIVRYKGTPEPLCSVIYTVPPKSLTKETVAADPMLYGYGAHVPGSRSYIATHTVKRPEGAVAKGSFEKVRQVAVPEGYTPFLVLLNNSGFQLVKMTRHVAVGAVPYDPTGAMLLRNGKVVELSAGPCAGPVVISSSPKHRIDALATDGLVTCLWAMRKTGKGAVIAVHRGRLCHWEETVTLEGKHIAEIATNDSRGWKKEFSAEAPKRLSIQLVKKLGLLYGMRHQLDRYRVVTSGFLLGDPTVKFDQARRRWRLEYQWGHMAVAGGRRTIILDERGRLIDLSEFIVCD